jgi:butyrate kinase
MIAARFLAPGPKRGVHLASVHRILALNPGGMSTKIAVYEGRDRVFEASVEHPREELARFEAIPDQLDYRKEAIEGALAEGGQTERPFDAVVGRGGLLKSIPSGVYAVNDEMLEDARVGFHGQHASNLGALLAKGLSEDLGGTPFIVDPVSVDEFGPLARYSGHRDIERKSLGHALNTKATAKKAAAELGKALSSLNLIVAHLGSGISITPLDGGKMVDVNNAASGGPFSPERTGGLPLIEMLDYMAERGHDTDRMKAIIVKEGGLQSYLGTNRFIEVIDRIERGDARAGEVVDAMAYQIAKEVGAMATVLRGRVDAIVLTGAMAHSDHLVRLVRERVGFIARVLVLPGENELESLAAGALAVLRSEEEARTYPTG